MKKFLILCGILIICVCILISCGNKKSNTPAVQEGASINAPYNETFNDGDTGQETLPTVPPDTNTPNNDEIDDSDKPNNNFGNEPPLDYSTAFYEDMIAYLQDKIKNEDGQEVDDVVKNTINLEIVCRGHIAT